MFIWSRDILRMLLVCQAHSSVIQVCVDYCRICTFCEITYCSFAAAWLCSSYIPEVHLISATFDCSALLMLSGDDDWFVFEIFPSSFLKFSVPLMLLVGPGKSTAPAVSKIFTKDLWPKINIVMVGCVYAFFKWTFSCFIFKLILWISDCISICWLNDKP